MNLEFLLIFFISRYFRKELNTKETAPDWDKKLTVSMYLGLGLMVLSISGQFAKTFFEWLALLSLIGFSYFIFREDFFKKGRFILVATAPFMAVSLFNNTIKLLLPEWYHSWHNLLETIGLFAVLWGFGVWMVTRRQRNELDKVKKQVIAEEENNRLITAMKADLEVQVKERTAEITRQKDELEVALVELKATQAQLVQSEKMASLGELTAGIAHEIQNPLNFVNNFSEVSGELLKEMIEEVDKGNNEEVKAIADDLFHNLEKINHHGKRADAIVKGMLQHSRTNTGTKEPTDINALCDEYLRLCYHGLRAKDKNFNANIKSEFDERLSAKGTDDNKVNLVPQDIGRLLLNLLTNAFYAVNEKRKQSGDTYKPTVTIRTQKMPGKLLVAVVDNGNGIPQQIVDKIFQPFFTTKPTGHGTGLGLSLSYDIVKAHGGKINVQTAEGEGTTFTIELPTT